MFGLVPFNSKSLQSGHDGFGGLFDIFNEPFFKDFPMTSSTSGKFKVDVKDNGKNYELTAELPGMSKENISLDYTNNYLTISAQRNDEKSENDEKGNYIRRERHFGSMSRSFYIDGIDDEKISAEFKDGVLKVDLPKVTQQIQQGKQITIH